MWQFDFIRILACRICFYSKWVCAPIDLELPTHLAHLYIFIHLGASWSNVIVPSFVMQLAVVFWSQPNQQSLPDAKDGAFEIFNQTSFMFELSYMSSVSSGRVSYIRRVKTMNSFVLVHVYKVTFAASSSWCLTWHSAVFIVQLNVSLNRCPGLVFTVKCQVGHWHYIGSC